MLKHLLISTSLFHFAPEISPINPGSFCDEIAVEVTTEDATVSGQSGKIFLRYGSGLLSAHFKVHLYAEKKAENRLDLTGIEIQNVKPGNYIIMIEGKQSGYCPKQFKVRIN